MLYHPFFFKPVIKDQSFCLLLKKKHFFRIPIREFWIKFQTLFFYIPFFICSINPCIFPSVVSRSGLVSCRLAPIVTAVFLAGQVMRWRNWRAWTGGLTSVLFCSLEDATVSWVPSMFPPPKSRICYFWGGWSDA